MALTAGDRLGPYEITECIGSGGMGDVYRARDSRLGRDVALKVLPEVFAQDPERLARFKREAQVLASLNHPHIAHIYGVEDGMPEGASPGHGIQHALVMELVEGVTLDELIQQSAGERGRHEVALSMGTATGALRAGGTRRAKRDTVVARSGRALPVDQALTIARQMAVALAAAHDHGIIHRDLKPANVKITDDGTVKVLDFGLAKPTPASATGRSALGADPTVTSPAATSPGAVLGTAAYMAPEQAKGQHVDKRADIWSFGCVLYEMLTGRRPFTGEDVSETMASVLKSDPDWHALPPDIPATVRLLVERCLVKDRRRRVGDFSTAIFLIDEAAAFEPAESDHLVVRRARAGWLTAAVAGLLAVAAMSALWLQWGRQPGPRLERTSLVLPPTAAVAFAWSPGQSLAISPDGRTVAYVSPNEDAPAGRGSQLRVRELDSRVVRDLPNTYQARQPFFSPDGRWVAFFTPAGELKKMPMTGGNPVTLMDKIAGSQWATGVWCESDTIVFIGAGGLQRLSADGGPARQLTTLNVAEREYSHYLWSYVPAARSVLFVTTFSQVREPRLDAVHIDTGARREVVTNARAGWFIPSGHLVFTRDDALLVAPFDAERLTLTGSPVPVLDEIRRDGLVSEGPVPQLAVAREGTLAYVPTPDISRHVMGRVSTDGVFEPVDLGPGRVQRPRVSPNGRRIAFETSEGQRTTVAVYDLENRTTSRLTQAGDDLAATWRPDGEAVVVFSRRPDARGLYLKGVLGSEELLLPGEEGAVLRPESFSPDGTLLAYTRQRGSQHDIWVLTPGKPSSARPLLETPASEHSPKLAPNGHALAYVSDESGRSEVYVRPFPQGAPIRVSTAGGFAPVWSRNGRQLFYASSQAAEPVFMGTPVTWQGPAFTLGVSSVVLRRRARGPSGDIEQYAGGANWGPGYDVLPDGRFLVLRGPDPQGAREIVLVQQWFDELRRLAPGR